MTTFDLSPLFRSTIGFDRLANMLDTASHTDYSGYPPYNIVLTGEDTYRISLAVAGFKETDLDIEIRENTLTVAGKITTPSHHGKYLHQGIAERNFKRSYQLADHVKVSTAHMENGLLHIDLERKIPDAMKPRKISIGNISTTEPTLETVTAA